MKKYLQYNNTHFREPPTDIGVHVANRQISDGHQNETRAPAILDLSGRNNVNHVAKVTEQKEPNEQEAALDLSKNRRQEVSLLFYLVVPLRG